MLRWRRGEMQKPGLFWPGYKASIYNGTSVEGVWRHRDIGSHPQWTRSMMTSAGCRCDVKHVMWTGAQYVRILSDDTCLAARLPTIPGRSRRPSKARRGSPASKMPLQKLR